MNSGYVSSYVPYWAVAGGYYEDNDCDECDIVGNFHDVILLVRLLRTVWLQCWSTLETETFSRLVAKGVNQLDISPINKPRLVAAM